MKTRLGGAKRLPVGSDCEGRSRPPSRYRRVLLPEPLVPTMETYSWLGISRSMPLRMWLMASPEPRSLWRFWARRGDGWVVGLMRGAGAVARVTIAPSDDGRQPGCDVQLTASGACGS